MLKSIVQNAARRSGVEIGRYPPRYHDVRRGRLLRTLNVDVVIDVGANEGQYAQCLRAWGGYTGDIVSFEPGSAAFERLLKSARNDDRWACRRTALMDRDGEQTLIIAAGDDLSSFNKSSPIGRANVPLDTTAEEQVSTARLDALFDELVGKQTPWLKIDVQGSESAVLDGAERSLDRIIGVEVEMPLVPVYEAQATASDTIARLEASDFRMVGVHPGFFDAELGLNLEFDGIFVRSGVLGRMIASRCVRSDEPGPTPNRRRARV